jgi:transposase
MLAHIAGLNGLIDAKTANIRELAAVTPVLLRLQTMPGIGLLVAMAVTTFAPDMERFRSGRDFATWLGRITKAGQTDIRRMLIIGAMSRLNWMGRKSIPEGSSLARMIASKPCMLVAIALANKMARHICARLTRHENYKDPTPVMAA